MRLKHATAVINSKTIMPLIYSLLSQIKLLQLLVLDGYWPPWTDGPAHSVRPDLHLDQNEADHRDGPAEARFKTSNVAVWNNNCPVMNRLA